MPIQDQELKYPEIPIEERASKGLSKEDFLEAHTISEGRTLIALGYGPLGEEESTFSPQFRRRYYLTREKLLEQFNFVHDNIHRFRDPDVKLVYEYLIGDMFWFLRGRDNVHTGTTPLMIAVAYGHPAVVQFLLEKGADPTITAFIAGNALHFACRRGSLEAVQLLTSKIDPNARTSTGETPLMLAAKNGHHTVIQFLLENGADTTITNGNGNGWNALHFACQCGSVEAVQLLTLTSKVGLNTKPSTCKTTFVLAAKNRHQTVIQFLL